jgi:hypothetical protein
MKFRILIVMIASAGLAVSGLANAVPITHYGYTLNQSTNIVTHTDGTEWLKWDQTLDKSIDSALSIYASQGWMLASNTQMAGLFADFGFANGTDEETTYFSGSPYVGGTDVEPHDFFIQLFGTTSYTEGPNYGTGNDAYQAAKSLFGADLDKDGRFNIAFVMSDGTHINDGQMQHGAHLMDQFWNTLSSTSRDDVGIALVRVAEVDEPGSFAIFTLGLICLGFRRFKKQT